MGKKKVCQYGTKHATLFSTNGLQEFAQHGLYYTPYLPQHQHQADKSAMDLEGLKCKRHMGFVGSGN